MNTKLRPLLVPDLLAAIAPAGGGHKEAAQTGGGTAHAAGGQTTVAFVTNNPSDCWTICRKGTEAAPKATSRKSRPAR